MLLKQITKTNTFLTMFCRQHANISKNCILVQPSWISDKYQRNRKSGTYLKFFQIKDAINLEANQKACLFDSISSANYEESTLTTSLVLISQFWMYVLDLELQKSLTIIIYYNTQSDIDCPKTRRSHMPVQLKFQLLNVRFDILYFFRLPSCISEGGSH